MTPDKAKSLAMNTILELREKRNKIWQTAKDFPDSKRGADGLVTPEGVATYDKMETDVQI